MTCTLTCFTNFHHNALHHRGQSDCLTHGFPLLPKFCINMFGWNQICQIKKWSVGGPFSPIAFGFAFGDKMLLVCEMVDAEDSGGSNPLQGSHGSIIIIITTFSTKGFGLHSMLWHSQCGIIVGKCCHKRLLCIMSPQILSYTFKHMKLHACPWFYHCRERFMTMKSQRQNR